MTTPIKTASWFTPLPHDHIRIGISRGTPRRATAGYRIFRKLAPGAWFNSVTDEQYVELYNAEVLGPLDPARVAAELHAMAAPYVPVLLCFEKVGGPQWCHRALVADWLERALGEPVHEVGHEELGIGQHPLWPVTINR